jgi:hypothetical protein
MERFLGQRGKKIPNVVVKNRLVEYSWSGRREFESCLNITQISTSRCKGIYMGMYIHRYNVNLEKHSCHTSYVFESEFVLFRLIRFDSKWFLKSFFSNG